MVQQAIIYGEGTITGTVTGFDFFLQPIGGDEVGLGILRIIGNLDAMSQLFIRVEGSPSRGYLSDRLIVEGSFDVGNNITVVGIGIVNLDETPDGDRGERAEIIQ